MSEAAPHSTADTHRKRSRRVMLWLSSTIVAKVETRPLNSDVAAHQRHPLREVSARFPLAP